MNIGRSTTINKNEDESMNTIILNKDNLHKLSEIERSYLQGIIDKIGISKNEEQDTLEKEQK